MTAAGGPRLRYGAALGLRIVVAVDGPPDDADVMADAVADALGPLAGAVGGEPAGDEPAGDELLVTVSGTPDGWTVNGDGPPEPRTEAVALRVQREVNLGVIERAQGHYLLLHGAAVELAGRLVVLAAPSGSGKSTMAAGLLLAGADYLTDEAVALDPVSLAASPYPKPLTLKRGSWPVLAEALEPLIRQADARDAEVLAGPAAFGARVSPGGTAPALVVLPEYGPDEPPGEAGPTLLAPADAVLELAQSTFGFAAHGRRDLAALARLVRSAPVALVRSAGLADGVTQVMELLEGLPPPAGGAAGADGAREGPETRTTATPSPNPARAPRSSPRSSG